MMMMAMAVMARKRIREKAGFTCMVVHVSVLAVIGYRFALCEIGHLCRSVDILLIVD